MLLSLFLISFAFSFVQSMCPYKGKMPRAPPLGHMQRRLDDGGTPLEGEIPMASDTNNPNVVANDYFHTVYSELQIQVTPRTKIISSGDYLVLYLRNGSRFVEPVVEDIYHNLKMISHLPLTAYSIVLGNSSGSITLDLKTLDNMTHFSEILQNVSITSDMFPDPQQLTTQQAIYSITLDFVNSVLLTKSCSFEQMANLAWSTNTSINDNLNDAAENQINLMNKVVMNWKTNVIPLSEWNDLYIASVGG
jgi:archaellum component FlaF (FlaF/FlaG flagellin family)